MRISVFGLGYVGIVSAGCLAREGHHVLGVDPNATKVDMVNAGRSPIIEAEMDEIVAETVGSGALRGTTSAAEAIQRSDLSLVCVGTPSSANGSLDLKHVRNVCREIGEALREKGSYHVVVMRSTMLPGSMRGTVIPELEKASGMKAGADFGVCNNPEFLREGTAVRDYYHPPKTLVGELDSGSGERLIELYADLPAPIFRTSVDVAELVKYVDNTWHALKVGFGNEIGRLCKALDLDSHAVMDIFVQDRKLNISETYLKPGFAFGGSCLPKDVRALSYMARALDVETPIVNAILPSNAQQIELALRMVMGSGARKVGLLGLSFKAGTDDLRESPLVELVERLIGKGFDVRIYDRNVNLAHLVGANRDYILNHIPHIAELFVGSAEDVLAHGDLIVIGNRASEFAEGLARLPNGKGVLDLVRLFDARPADGGYQGISW
jgi:GDP-mannose 6-dehydrogenase